MLRLLDLKINVFDLSGVFNIIRFIHVLADIKD